MRLTSSLKASGKTYPSAARKTSIAISSFNHRSTVNPRMAVVNRAIPTSRIRPRAQSG
jgi:hypothetical protein